jgi:hypothetical protein
MVMTTSMCGSGRKRVGMHDAQLCSPSLVEENVEDDDVCWKEKEEVKYYQTHQDQDADLPPAPRGGKVYPTIKYHREGIWQDVPWHMTV